MRKKGTKTKNKNNISKRKKRVSKVIKTRNAGTMTDAAFFSFIRSKLRQASRFWKPILACKQHAKRPYNGPNKRQRFEYQCNKCKEWFPDKQVAVDHTIPCGSLNSFSDLPGFVERLFVEEDGLKVLCNKCHDIKTKKEKDERK